MNCDTVTGLQHGKLLCIASCFGLRSIRGLTEYHPHSVTAIHMNVKYVFESARFVPQNNKAFFFVAGCGGGKKAGQYSTQVRKTSGSGCT